MQIQLAKYARQEISVLVHQHKNLYALRALTMTTVIPVHRAPFAVEAVDTVLGVLLALKYVHPVLTMTTGTLLQHV
jgi:hypothetical protein